MNHLTPLAVAAALCVALSAQAQRTPLNGRLLASNCFQCDGTNGRGPGFERLSDKSAREIFRELREMKSDDDDDLMAHHARGYTDAQLLALSRHLARQR